uniref:Prepilin leader peptidase/N-methyltransferase n=1 Tax=candidate division WOR-3 bacterium TaxID=2052148 RepID=A0A7C4UBE0_UNCW3
MIIILIFFIGASLGSFLNVIINRLPKKISIVFPPSHCPYCGNKIRFYDNIPVISYIILKGRCRFCKKPISPRYIIVESISGIIPVFLYIRYGFSLDFLKISMYLFLMIPISFIDIETMLIPDVIAIPGIFAGIIISFFKGEIFSSLTGAFAGGITIILIYFTGRFIFKKEAMGLGDIRVAALIGSFTSAPYFFLSLFIASILGSVYGIYFVIKNKKDMKTEIPFGPFLASGGFIVLIFGEYISKLFTFG